MQDNSNKRKGCQSALWQAYSRAKKTRIFPLLELGSIKSRHLEPVIARIQEQGYKSEITPVPYEFQKGGNEMLTIIPIQQV